MRILPDEQNISIHHQVKVGVSIRVLCSKHAISGATVYTSRKWFGCIEVPEVKRTKFLGEDNVRHNKLLFETMLNNVSQYGNGTELAEIWSEIKSNVEIPWRSV